MSDRENAPLPAANEAEKMRRRSASAKMRHYIVCALRAWRANRMMSQARAAKWLCVSRKTYIRWENGLNIPQLHNRVRLLMEKVVEIERLAALMQNMMQAFDEQTANARSALNVVASSYETPAEHETVPAAGKDADGIYIGLQRDRENVEAG